jgi:putative mRNA 3-end processing factor
VADDLIVSGAAGLQCRQGGFHVDPWGAAEVAVISHPHGDHLRPGSRRYVCSAEAAPFVRRRLAPEPAAEIVPVGYGERIRLGGVEVSFHPAGHVRGSAQVRIEAGGRVWVVSGDYKRAADPTCTAFEVVPCDVFVTEATFALPVYRWPETRVVVEEILQWWDSGRAAGTACVLLCYAMGKAQRILAELSALTDRTVMVHGAVEGLTGLYREAGVPMLPTRKVAETERGRSFAGELILAPPAAAGTTWMRRFGRHETALASGWMRLRGTRRRRSLDRGFPLSDHADWPALLRTVNETGARRVLVTHGYADELSRYLAERGYETGVLHTPFEGEADLPA